MMVVDDAREVRVELKVDGERKCEAHSLILLYITPTIPVMEE